MQYVFGYTKEHDLVCKQETQTASRKELWHLDFIDHSNASNYVNLPTQTKVVVWFDSRSHNTLKVKHVEVLASRISYNLKHQMVWKQKANISHVKRYRDSILCIGLKHDRNIVYIVANDVKQRWLQFHFLNDMMVQDKLLFVIHDNCRVSTRDLETRQRSKHYDLQPGIHNGGKDVLFTNRFLDSQTLLIAVNPHQVFKLDLETGTFELFVTFSNMLRSVNVCEDSILVFEFDSYYEIHHSHSIWVHPKLQQCESKAPRFVSMEGQWLLERRNDDTLQLYNVQTRRIERQWTTIDKAPIINVQRVSQFAWMFASSEHHFFFHWMTRTLFAGYHCSKNNMQSVHVIEPNKMLIHTTNNILKLFTFDIS